MNSGRVATTNSMIKQVKTVLLNYYGKKLAGLVLYGSMARKQAGEESDIDLLVLLIPPIDYFTELRRIVDLLYPFQLESEQLISAKPAELDEYKRGMI
ncbi:MAG: nucleotidyltransferase domain-containing protein [Anaerolineales bacterium]|nr:nucleotidyltransferase domain-containing protein [Anaerolineales bacterium]